VLAHIGMWGAVIAALGLIRFAISGKGSWWQLILILLTLGGIAMGLLWVLGAGGLKPDRHAGPAPVPVVSASPAVGTPAGIKSPPPSGAAAISQRGQGSSAGQRPRSIGHPLAKLPVRHCLRGHRDRAADRVGHVGDSDVDVLPRIPRSPRAKVGTDHRDPAEFGHRHTAAVSSPASQNTQRSARLTPCQASSDGCSGQAKGVAF